MRVASCSYDGTTRLWDVSTGECLRSFSTERRYERLDITGLTGVTEAERLNLIALGANDRTSRRIDFQTAATATTTGNAAERINAHVANLSRGIVHSVPQSSIQNDSAANACSECHTNNRALAAGGSLPHLADGSGVGIVLQNRRPL